ncbi:MAG: glycosyltransferase family 2 protein [Kiritimatiellae bacterium]|nr:glycosyltransferase family 2 protein [Kiritimatiellia bacterium]MDD4734689.1 glycosyltransferase family 2 protein [Kiritimatiellia bacterium]
MTPSASIIIVNYNGGAMLRTCLDSVKRQTFRDYEVIVVDNGSKDDSLDIPFLDTDPQYRVIRLNRNSGFSEANNIALKQVRGEFIVLLNNDVVLDSSWLGAMIHAAQPAQIGSVACQLRQANAPHLLDSVGFAMFFNGSADTFYGCDAQTFNHATHIPYAAAASAALYKKSALDKLKFLFHDEYFAYYEDNDLAFRLRAFGYNVAYASDAIGWHIGSATGKRKSKFHVFHLRRNIEFFFWINTTGKHILRYGLLHLISEGLAFYELIKQGRPGVFIRAKIAFLRYLPWAISERKKLFGTISRKSHLKAESLMMGFGEYIRFKKNSRINHDSSKMQVDTDNNSVSCSSR